MARRRFDHFDILAPWYDQAVQAPASDTLQGLIGPGPKRVLDAGGGTGRISLALLAPGRQIVLADASLKMLRHAKAPDQLRRVGAAAEQLPFPDDCFDCVLMVDALHHVRHQDLSLREMWRVVSPGGRLLVEEPDIDQLAVKLIAAAEKLALMRSHFLRGEEVAVRLDRLGAQTRVERQDHTLWVIADKADR
ncbi:MAG: methyltransferase domain-containing protein [Anaerolineales bacterium]|nr:methyltransferase domain-containing protein [Anaerolineales bacterium]